MAKIYSIFLGMSPLGSGFWDLVDKKYFFYKKPHFVWLLRKNPTLALRFVVFGVLNMPNCNPPWPLEPKKSATQILKIQKNNVSFGMKQRKMNIFTISNFKTNNTLY